VVAFSLSYPFLCTADFITGLISYIHDKKHRKNIHSLKIYPDNEATHSLNWFTKEYIRSSHFLGMENILITGAFGQVGTDLILALKDSRPNDTIIASDIRIPGNSKAGVEQVILDVRDQGSLRDTISKYNITKIYHLASILSASAEKDPFLAYDVNINGTFGLLKIAYEKQVRSVIIPSSIAVYGPGISRDMVGSGVPTVPQTMYGISKVTGELLGNYFYRKFGLDVRGVRFPGLISYETVPTAGTTDYAVEMFISAVKGREYSCYLRPDTFLPMMYMPDALNALIKLSDAPPDKLGNRMSYNVSAFSFSPEQLAAAIKRHIPDFEVSYQPDERQKIADGWPRSLDSSDAIEDWGFTTEYGFDAMVSDMISKLRSIMGRD
jgi:threonine 3-dehydrogenase